MQNQQVKIYHTASVSQIKQVAMLLKYMFANTPKDIHFEVAENGHISFRNEGLYKMPLTGEMPQNEAEARAAAQRWFANFQTWREKIHQTYKEQYKHPKHSFPDFFHEGLQFVKAEPHYHEKVGNLHHWRVYFAVQNEDSQLLADDYVYIDLHRNNPEILMGCEYCTLPVLRSESVAPIFELTEKQIKSLIYRRGIGDSLVPMLPTAEGEVQVTKLGVMRGEKLPFSIGNDYMVFVNEDLRVMNFFLDIYYNKNNINIKVDVLRNLWTEQAVKERVRQMKIEDFAESPLPDSILYKTANKNETNILWRLTFSTRLIPYDGPPFDDKYIADNDFNDVNNPERRYADEIRENTKSAFILNCKEGAPHITNPSTRTISLHLDNGKELGGFNREETSFSHEIGHVWFLGEGYAFNHKANPLWNNVSNRLYPYQSHEIPSTLMSWDYGKRVIYDFEYEVMLITILQKIVQYKEYYPQHKNHPRFMVGLSTVDIF